LFEKYAVEEEVFLAFANENRKYVVQFERVYYGAISDALEGCFAFDLEADENAIDTKLPKNRSYADDIDKVIEMERKIISFYTEAAEQSKSLMADLTRAFTMIARKRGSRISNLGSLIRKGTDG
jgi:rubrerythrin